MTLVLTKVLTKSKVLQISGTKTFPETTQSALEFSSIHCPNGRLGQDLGFGGFAFAPKLPELLNTNFAAVRAKLGQIRYFPYWAPNLVPNRAMNLAALLGPMSITKLSPNWACQMGPIHSRSGLPPRSLPSHPGHQRLQFAPIIGTGVTLCSFCSFIHSPGPCILGGWSLCVEWASVVAKIASQDSF